ncbi:hypothetical protein G7Z17_g2643 [Cylindrodendrum hubeiense]|uniref:Ankyrin repeat protein n=1 Tax=Cylindrodendrum hubeiense TaxID=595255 RepID=A0A9P5LIY0_9HYPO|nr:hypothetical protein G7Z17_g2643 [Cylindrodendrum hubeiense]
MMAASRYHNFRRDPPEGLEDNQREDFFIVDEDGERLYEAEFGGLFLTMVKHNDVAMIKRYLTKYTWPIWPGVVVTDNAFWNAVHYGSSDALHMLLEHEGAYPSQPPSYKAQMTMLNEACFSARIDMVLYLLDSQAAFASIQERDGDCRMNALLSAACSLTDMADMYNHEPRSEFVTRREKLMALLLDRGACARDVLLRPHLGEQPEDTVLTLAISRASAKMVKRLLSEGADMHTKTMHFGFPNFEEEFITDATALHFGSQYCNIDGIRVLIEQSDNAADMVACRDSFGRLPLHYAAAGRCPILASGRVIEDETQLYIRPTMDLLLDVCPATINVQDKKGDTALHHAVKRHRQCGGGHVNTIVETLCGRGADASICNDNGETPLHLLSFHVLDGDPIETSLVDLLLAHGGNLNAVDADGNTPLHWAARNLRHLETTRHLLSRGADSAAGDDESSTGGWG